MGNNRLSLEEQETHIWFDPVSKKWTVETSYPPHMRLFEKQHWEKVNEQCYDDGTVESVTFTEANKKAIRVVDPTKKRELTEEQREQIRERFRKIRAGEKVSEDTSAEDEDEEDDDEDEEDA